MKMFKIFLPIVMVLLTVVGLLYKILREFAIAMENTDWDFEDDDNLDIITTKEQ